MNSALRPNVGFENPTCSYGLLLRFRRPFFAALFHQTCISAETTGGIGFGDIEFAQGAVDGHSQRFAVNRGRGVQLHAAAAALAAGKIRQLQLAQLQAGAGEFGFFVNQLFAARADFVFGFEGVGRYYVALGAVFLLLQLFMRYWFLPMMFKRQFVKYQFGKSEQGLDLYQDYADLYANGRKATVNYADVQNFASGKLTYMLELKNKTVIIVPKRAINDSADKTIFENTFNKK